MKRKGLCPKAEGHIGKCEECQFMSDDGDEDE